MDWVVTAPPVKTFARYEDRELDVIAVRVPTGPETDPDLVKTEFLLAGAHREPEWVPVNLISGAVVEAAH